MTSVITKRYKKNKFLISKGWKSKSASKFVRETRKAGLYATTLNSIQDRKLRSHKHITIPLIKRIKKRY